MPIIAMCFGNWDSRWRLANQRRWPAPPACAPLADRLNVLDVGGGLRKDVVKVVSDADETEPLVEKLGSLATCQRETGPG